MRRHESDAGLRGRDGDEAGVGARFHAVREHGRHGFDAAHHAAVVVAFAEGGQHIIRLDAFAKRVGQHALDAAPRHEADFALLPHKQDAHAVAVLAAADAPLREELVGEREGIAARNGVDGHHGHLRRTALAQAVADRVDARHGRLRKDPVGIRREARTVGRLHVFDLFHRVGMRRGGQPRAQADQQEEIAYHRLKDKSNFPNRQALSERFGRPSQNPNRCTTSPGPDHSRIRIR